VITIWYALSSTCIIHGVYAENYFVDISDFAHINNYEKNYSNAHVIRRQILLTPVVQ